MESMATEQDIILLQRLGIDRAHLSPLLAVNVARQLRSEAPDAPLSSNEVDVLKAGGALGLDGTAEARQQSRQNSTRLLLECRRFAAQALDIRSVSVLLGLPEAEVEAKARKEPAALHSFESANATLRFPRWQFNDRSTIPHLEQLLRAIRPPINVLALHQFMTEPLCDLEIDEIVVSPREWLVSGRRPSPILDLMRNNCVS
jgi:hypothetical protein